MVGRLGETRSKGLTKERSGRRTEASTLGFRETLREAGREENREIVVGRKFGDAETGSVLGKRRINALGNSRRPSNDPCLLPSSCPEHESALAYALPT